MFAAEAAETAVPWLYENVWLIPALPAASFLLILFFGKRLPFKGAEIGITAVVAAFVLAVLTTFTWIGDVESGDTAGVGHSEESGDHGEDEGALLFTDGVDGEPVRLTAGTLAAVEEGDGHGESRGAAVVTDVRWFESGLNVFRIGTLVDGQSVMMLFVVTFISMLVHIYSTDYVNGDRRYTHYFAFLSLFTAAMLFMVLASSTLQLIVGWELVGVCSFALIGHWWEERPNSDAALKAFLTNRVGDIGLLIGVITLYFGAGQTFNILEINEKAVTGEISSTLLTVSAVCLMAAVMSKSGQFILHTWLPDAMAGPTPVSALIHAATMVVAGVYMIGRLYPVFFEGFSIYGSNINLMAFIGGLTTVGGGALAFVQRDIKKVLAYSTVSQLGYMVLALGMGAYTAGMFHLFTHAFFKACLFLGAGSVSHACHHSFDMKADMGGLRKHMPITFATFMVGSAALAGLPPLAGFWSKDEILVGAGVWPGTGGNGTYTIPFIFGMITAAMTAAYMTRTVWLTFFGEYRGHDHPHESGRRITTPLIILAGMATVVGFLNVPSGFAKFFGLGGLAHKFEDWVEPAGQPYFPPENFTHAKPSLSLAIVATLLAVGAGFVVLRYYQALYAKDPKASEYSDGIRSRNSLAAAGYRVLENKYYLDHLYTGIIAGATKGPVARAAGWFNQNVLDGIVNVAGFASVHAGRFIYRFIDQGIVDGTVNASGRTASGSGQFLRRIQTGQIRQYATLMFGAAALLVAVFIVAV
ncbi:MAG: NADH-quinone oxidoreductase subunit L [Actinomycetota bacterium]